MKGSKHDMGLPYQRCIAEDHESLPEDEPTEIQLDLLPTAMVIKAGHRLRISIMGADKDNTSGLGWAEGCRAYALG